MNESEGATAGITSNQVINTTQPIPLTNYNVRGVRKLETVKCVRPGGKDGEFMLVNKANYDEEIHGPLFVEKLPSRKRKAKAKGKGNKKSNAKKKKSESEE